MRRLTNGQPIAGAFACSWTSSWTYSLGSASGIVASSCATFISGPLMPPSAAFRSAAWRLAVDRQAEIALAGEPRGEPGHGAVEPARSAAPAR